LIASAQSGFTRLHLFIRKISQSITNILEHNPQKNNVPALDGVRAVACLMVLAFHLNFLLQLWNITKLGHLAIAIALSGDTGVALFFVLSGFLLFLPYAKALLFDSSWPSLRRFYLRRVFRIIPGYYVSLFLMILLFHPEYLHLDHLKYLALFLTFFMDSSRATYQQINGPFWSLAVEWQFYLLLPFMALGMRFIVQHGSLQRRLVTLLSCLFAIIVWGIVSRYYGAYIMAHPQIPLFGSRTVLRVILFSLYGTSGAGFHGKFLEDFAVGMTLSLVYILASSKPHDGALNVWLRRLTLWLWGFGLILLTIMAMWESNQANPTIWLFLKPLHPYYLWWREILLSIGFASCIAAILFDNGGLKHLFEWAPMRWIGLISYSLYMWHLPLLLVFSTYFGPYLQHLSYAKMYTLYWLWVLVAIIPFSLVFYLLIEKPWMRLSDRLLQNKRKQKKAQAA
jgi:peptidoglycan/LPS O-acetylase OafA/YrhL